MEVVEREEAQATVKAKETQAIADDAQRDLNEALPALVSHRKPFIPSHNVYLRMALRWPRVYHWLINISFHCEQEEAVASLKSLNKNDVVEVRAMTRPPLGVKMVVEAVCIMKEVKPKKIAGDKPGERINDYWDPGKALLSDPGKFLESLFKFDKDNIPDDVIKKIQPLIDNPDFTPAAIAKVSQF